MRTTLRIAVLLAIVMPAIAFGQNNNSAPPEISMVLEGPAEARLEQKITYSIKIRNSAAVPSPKIVVRAYVPAGQRYKHKEEGAVLRWDLRELASGETLRLSYEVTALRCGTFTHDVELYLADRVVHQASCRTRVVAPHLRIAVEGPRLTFLHQPMECVITITNVGDGATRELEIVIFLPRHLICLNSSPPGMFCPGGGERLATMTWNFPELPANDKIKIVLQARSNMFGHCRIYVKLISKTNELPPISPLDAYLEFSICGPGGPNGSTYDTEDPVEVGKSTVYVIEFRNDATSNCTGVQMASIIPQEMEFMKAEGPGVLFRRQGNTVIFDAVPVLPPGEKLTWKILCRAIKPGSAKHTAILKYNEFRKPIVDEEGTSVYK